MSGFSPLDSQLLLDQPRRLTEVDSWHEHMPFAFLCIEQLKPRVFVELGTWKGDSYCAFCQAVQTLGFSNSCYAVDTWKGDQETGSYGSEVLNELHSYHDPLYGAFSRLLEQTFDEANAHFADGSIDLLHIDGYHSYESVRHDFETWLPKLSERGVVLLHDTNVRERSFGVWRLWEEVREQYPSFAFTHGHGLGVLAIGPDVDADFVGFLAEAARPASRIAQLFFVAGSRVALGGREQRLHAELEWRRRDLPIAQEALVATKAELTARDGKLAAMEEKLRAVEANRDSMVQSASWRITAPLRRVHAARSRITAPLRRANAVAREARRRASLRGAAGDSRDEGLGESASAAKAFGHGPLVSSSGHIRELAFRPLISVITPVFNTNPRWLARAVDSVAAQTYPRWELCLCDDGSTLSATVDTLERVAGSDPRIKLVRSEKNEGIAAASNRALALAEGDFVALLDHDDELEPNAFLECVRLLNEKQQTDVVYTDEDKIDTTGRCGEPFLKPDWSPEYFRGVMYVGHLLLTRRTLVEEVGGFDSAFDGVQDYELMLRVSEQTDRIEHVPRVLYHWRKLPESLASATNAKLGISELQAAAVNAHLDRCGFAAVADPHPTIPHRVVLHPSARERWPPVSVVIPTKDAPEHISRCLDSIFSRSTYPNFEVIVVDNCTGDPDARRALGRHPIKVVPFDDPFNYARANNLGVGAANGDYVVLLNNDTEVLTPDWLESLVWRAEQPTVGAVGALLLYPDRTVQHAGVVLGLRGTADHIMRGFPNQADGYAGSLSCTREVSAVSAACMVAARALYEELGGLDEHYQTHYQDVDFCLRIRETGRRILYTPRATLVHYESASRGDEYDHVDRALLLDAWGETIARRDPYYPRGLSLDGADYRPTPLAT